MAKKRRKAKTAKRRSKHVAARKTVATKRTRVRRSVMHGL